MWRKVATLKFLCEKLLNSFLNSILPFSFFQLVLKVFKTSFIFVRITKLIIGYFQKSLVRTDKFLRHKTEILFGRVLMNGSLLKKVKKNLHF